MNEKLILQEIESTFPYVEMPVELTKRSPRFIESYELDQDIDEFRSHPLTAQAIRAIHRYLPVLSAEAVRWLLPYLLRFCLSDQGKQFSRNETVSLFSFLSPRPEFADETRLALSLLTTAQISCLKHFLEICLEDKYWDEFLLEDIGRGIAFLNSVDQ